MVFKQLSNRTQATLAAVDIAAQERRPMRVMFFTSTIKPRGVPDFPYKPTQIDFDRVVYVGVLHEVSANNVELHIKTLWPESTVLEIEENVDNFLQTDGVVHSMQFGTVARPAKLPWWRRARGF